ncbi:hypothetical protein [Microbacterium sp. SD291]|uniref:hypothetical protein n=1 Tax=Microbacterium sp. SD291 TaxID=2782007 RepID=UPI001A9651FE|nr:hypothetical protein [Microbacterium sp. SD291]MBO0982170.1 hypothetical protein [Microbacterium sp. SD291]
MIEQPRTPGAQGAGMHRNAAPPTRIEGPSGEVERPTGSARLPGARRDAYTKLPTGPVSVEPVVATGPDVDHADADPDWEPSAGAPVADDSRLAPWALLAAIVALSASFFVGWGIPVAVVAVVAASMSLRRPAENHAMARWALVLGLCAMVYSLGWLVWAGMQFERLG